MSQQELSLGILHSAALDEAVGGSVTVPSLANWLNRATALGNPHDLFQLWTPRLSHRQRISEFCAFEWESPDGPPNEGETSFVIDAEPQVFGTGAAVSIRYVRNRNADLLECAENIALDNGGDGLDDDTIELVREHSAHRLPRSLTTASTRLSAAYNQRRDCGRSQSSGRFPTVLSMWNLASGRFILTPSSSRTPSLSRPCSCPRSDARTGSRAPPTSSL